MLARGASFDQIGSELLRALDACRPQCLSLHDASGDVLWLNAGVIGPDEHGYVLDALDEFALEPERTHMQRRLADNRRGLFMGTRDPAGNCCGLVFVIIDCPGGPEENQPMGAPLAALMRRLSMLLAPSSSKQATASEPRAAVAAVVRPPPSAVEVTELELELEPASAKPAATPEPRVAVATFASSRATAVEVTELELEPNEPLVKAPINEPKSTPNPKPKAKAEPRPPPAPAPAPAEKPAAVSEANAVTMIAPSASLPSSASITQVTGESFPIRARKFVRLQGRGTNRRYEITILSPGEGQDIRILKAVSAWLSHHLDQYTEEHASFAVPVTAAAALDGRFVAALGGVLAQRPLPDGMLGLLLPSAAWRHPGTAPLLAQCERLRCPVTLDDFSLRHDGFQILRSKAIRMVKLDPQLTGPAMNDRFARAALAAITQSARVLGFHCIAKGDISSAGARWLASAGIDYADPSTASAASGQAPRGAARRSLGQAS